MNKLGLDVEMRKRLFWSCYTMDRQVSYRLGGHSLSPTQTSTSSSHLTWKKLQRYAGSGKGLKDSSRSCEDRVHLTYGFLARFATTKNRVEHSANDISCWSINECHGCRDRSTSRPTGKWKSLIPLDAKRHVDRDVVPFDGYDYYGTWYPAFCIPIANMYQ